MNVPIIMGDATQTRIVLILPEVFGAFVTTDLQEMDLIVLTLMNA